MMKSEVSIALLFCMSLLSGCGAMEDVDTPALAVGRHHYQEYKELCDEGRFVEAAFEYEYGLNKYGYAMRHQPPRSHQLPVNIPTEPLLEPLAKAENVGKLVEVEEWGDRLPFLGPKTHELLSKMLNKPATVSRMELLAYYSSNAARLQWDAKAGAFVVNPALPAGQKLPPGFEPVKDSPLSEDGYPLRIVCLKDGSEMVYVPAATVKVSFTPTEGTTVTGGRLYIDRYEVTNSQYLKFCKEQNHALPEYARYWKGDGGMQKKVLEGLSDPQQPVTCIRQEDAVVYSRWAGKAVPTEDEWYIAAMGGSKGPFPWGTLSKDATQADLERYGIVGRGDPLQGARPAKVGGRTMGASWCGAEDMLGNVSEWVARRENGSCFTMGFSYFNKWPEKLGYDAWPELDFPGMPAQKPWIGVRCVLLLNG